MYGTTLVGERKRTAAHSEYVGMAGYVDDCEIEGCAYLSSKCKTSTRLI